LPTFLRVTTTFACIMRTICRCSLLWRLDP